MREKISLDFETRSIIDLKKVGAFKYSEHPSTKVLILAISKNSGPVITWDIREEPNEAVDLLREAIELGWEIHAFNYTFEWAILKYVCPRQFGLPIPNIEQMRCTQAVCRSAGLPPSLGACAEFLELPIQKDKMGDPLIQKFCKPQKKTNRFIEWNDDTSFTAGGERMTAEEAFQKFVDYCATDVRTEMLISETMQSFELKGFPLEWFQLDARLNDRGLPVDGVALRRAFEIMQIHEQTLMARFKEITGFGPKQNARVMEWLRSRGYRGKNLTIGTREAFGNDPAMSQEAKEALSIVADLSFAAVKKVPAMLQHMMEDGRARGVFKWCGAQKTWRWTSSGIQVQNMKKPPKWLRKVIEEAYQDVRMGRDLTLLEMCYGNPYELVACLARYFVRFDDKNLFDLDFASVEARVLPELIECDRILEKFVSGQGDIYTKTAESLGKSLKDKFGVDFKIDRDTGKTVVLACIAEGELVLTCNGITPIEKITVDDLVWDGVEWVHHEGLIYRGTKEVMSYQGLTATPDHKVFVEGCEGPIPFEVAARKLHRIKNTGTGRTPVRVLDLSVSENNEGEINAKGRSGVSVRLKEISVLGFSEEGDFNEVSSLQRDEKQEALSKMDSRKTHCGKIPLPESSQPRLQGLRSEGDRVQVSKCICGVPVGSAESRFETGSRNRPQEQRWALRDGEPKVCHQKGADDEHQKNSSPCGLHVPPEGLALWSGSGPQETESGTDSGTDFEGCETCGSGETKELGRHSKKVRVYDLLNAGPRHRFTVSNVLVSNCQFQGGWNAVFTATGSKWKRPWCEAAAKIVRDENPEFPAAWRKFQDSFVSALDSPEKWHTITKHVSIGYTRKGAFPRMLMKLASGRSICWPKPAKDPITMVKIETVDGKVISKRWERIQGHFSKDEVGPNEVRLGSKDSVASTFKTWEISFYGHVKGKLYGRCKTYGGDMLQSATQGTAADLLAYGAIEAEKRGFEPLLLVHDQCLATGVGDKEDFRKAMISVPPWFEGFPLDAESEVVRSYCKN